MKRAIALLVLAVAVQTHAYEAIRIPTTHYHYDVGVAAIEENEFARAVENLRLVVADEPKNADAHAWLGFAYAKLGQQDLALRHLRDAVRLDPRHVRAHRDLGEAYLAAGDKARARETLAALRRLCKPPCAETAELERALGAAR
jgi:Flp pilus assembly protein TadD